MSRERSIAVAVALVSAAGSLVDIALLDAGLLHAALLGSLVVAAAAVCGRALPRAEGALLAALLVALWSLVYHASAIGLAVALGPAAFCLASPRNRWLAAVLASAFAGLATWGLQASPTASGLAATIAFLAAAARPRLPTGQQLGALRAASLFTPGVLLLGLMVANAATGYADDIGVRRVVVLAVGLAGLGTYLGLAGLGQTTLMESDDPVQRHAWLGLAAGLAVPAGRLASGDPSSVLAALPVAAAPLALAATVTAARLDRGRILVPGIAPSIIIVAVVGQLGL